LIYLLLTRHGPPDKARLADKRQKITSDNPHISCRVSLAEMSKG